MVWCSLICGNATDWVGEADLVLTTPYAPLPNCLRGKPTIIVQKDRDWHKRNAENWTAADLTRIGGYNDVAVYVANLPPIAFCFDGLKDGEFFPLELPLTLLATYGRPGMAVWDGFMGRGTVGMACAMLDMNFIGIDIDPKRVEIAKRYLDETEL